MNARKVIKIAETALTLAITVAGIVVEKKEK